MNESGEHQRARLAYEASLRALDQQRSNVEEIRSRTGILVAVASLSASFLGARAFAEHAGVAFTLSALVALVTTLALGVSILVPRSELVFSVLGCALYTNLAGIVDVADQHRFLARWLDALWERNELPIRSLNVRFQLAATALVTQILGWARAIVGSL